MTAAPLNAYAKLNLGLHILGKLESGYHKLQSLIAFADIADMLQCSNTPPAQSMPLSHHYEDIDLTLHVASNQPLDSHFLTSNLIYQAAKTLYDYALEYNTGEPCPTHMALEKNIPIGAGLGGGSSDAAAAFHALNQQWNINLPTSKLAELASALGSDIAACLTSRAQWMSGTGNTLAPAHINAELWAVIVYPNIALSSAAVYQAFSSSRSQSRDLHNTMPKFGSFCCDDAESLIHYLQQTENHLTKPAIQCTAEITDALTALERLPNAQLTRMSGSGSACFALFNNEAAAKTASDQLTQNHPDWWVGCAKLIF